MPDFVQLWVYLSATPLFGLTATLVVYLLYCVSDSAVERFGASVLLTSLPVAMGLLRYLQLVLVMNKGAAPTDLVVQDPGLVGIVAIFIAMFGVLIYF